MSKLDYKLATERRGKNIIDVRGRGRGRTGVRTKISTSNKFYINLLNWYIELNVRKKKRWIGACAKGYLLALRPNNDDTINADHRVIRSQQLGFSFNGGK